MIVPWRARLWGIIFGEIEQSYALRVFGVSLCLAHVGVFGYWFAEGRIGAAATGAENNLCWPMFQSCEGWKFLSSEGLQWAGKFYLGAAILAGGSFLLRRTVFLGVSILGLLVFAKLYFYLLHFRFAANPHLIFFIAHFVFIFLPNKNRTLRLTVCSIYLMAASLKFNVEWLSGAAVPLHWIRPESFAHWLLRQGLFPAACAYVLFLESFMTFALLSHRRIIRWFGLGQFFLFHVVSIAITGWFFPLLMFCLLSIFVFDPPERGQRNLGLPSVLFLIFLWGMQFLSPVFPRESLVAGVGRLLKLDMYKGSNPCQSTVIAEYVDHSVEIHLDPGLYFGDKGVRHRCDPYVHFIMGKRECVRVRPPGESLLRLRWSLNLQMENSTASDRRFKQVATVSDLCAGESLFPAKFPGSWALAAKVPPDSTRFPVFTFGPADNPKRSGGETKDIRFEVKKSSGGTFQLQALDRFRGLRWFYETNQSSPLPMDQPLSDGTSLFLATRSQVLAFDASTGAIAWIVKIDEGRIATMHWSERLGKAALDVWLQRGDQTENPVVTFDAKTGFILENLPASEQGIDER